MEGGQKTEDTSFATFLKWAAELGISDSLNPQTTHYCLGQSLIVSDFPMAGGRGLGAVRDLREGELVLKVPRSALMTRDSVSKDLKLSIAIDRHPSLSSFQILTVCLLYEIGKGKRSCWYQYLMHLPRSYDILATFGEFEKQALQVNDAIWDAEKAVLKAETEWREACELMSELMLKPKLLSFKAWLWASATISSRTLHIPWDEAGCLCPVGDLFNYAAPGMDSNGSEVLDDQRLQSSQQVNSCLDMEVVNRMDANQVAHSERLTDGGFDEYIAAYCFYAKRNYRKGEQVLLTYGTYTNLELLEHYGFILNENPNDKAFIPLEPGMYSCSSWPKESLYIHQNGKPSFALLSTLRLYTTPANQRKSIGHLVYSGSRISLNNEILVMKWISKKCEAILKKLPTSIEEDALLLSNINKTQEFDGPAAWGKMADKVGGELRACLESIGRQNAEKDEEVVFSAKSKMCIEKWKLAVQWRLWYKTILADCVCYCKETYDSSIRTY